MYHKNNDATIYEMSYGSAPYGSSAFGGLSIQLVSCPTETKYSGDTITLKATPKGGTAPYYVEFRKNGTTIDPSRLGSLSNPIINAPEDIEITRTYILNDADIVAAITGTITFSVYMVDSCPTVVQSCTQECTINIGCLTPVCNFTVT